MVVTVLLVNVVQKKRFEKADLKYNPQDRLVQARDGKCGLSAQGINSAEIPLSKRKITEGLCGQ